MMNKCDDCIMSNCCEELKCCCEQVQKYGKAIEQRVRADVIEEFIKEHTSLNFRGEPYIFITNTEFEQLKEK